MLETYSNYVAITHIHQLCRQHMKTMLETVLCWKHIVIMFPTHIHQLCRQYIKIMLETYNYVGNIHYLCCKHSATILATWQLCWQHMATMLATYGNYVGNKLHLCCQHKTSILGTNAYPGNIQLFTTYSNHVGNISIMLSTYQLCY